QTAGQGRADRGDEPVSVGVLQQVAAHAEPQRLQGVLLVVEGGQEQDLLLRLASKDALRCGHPVENRHADVEDDEIEVPPGAPVDGLLAVGRLGRDLEVGRRLDHQLDALAHQRLVLRQEDGRWRPRLVPTRWHVPHAVTGNDPRTRKVLVPAITSSSPPAASTRSLIAVSPKPGSNDVTPGLRSFSTSNRTRLPPGTSTFTRARRAAAWRIALVNASCTAR